MRSVPTLILALILVATAAQAQSQPPAITSASLVGIWARRDETSFLVFRPDSTFGWSHDEKTFQHWRSLHGDTLVLKREPGYRVTLGDETLTLTLLARTRLDSVDERLGPIVGTFRRLDAAPPLSPQFVAGLTGTWVGGLVDSTGQLVAFKDGRRIAGTEDTMIFRPDSTIGWIIRPDSTPNSGIAKRKVEFTHWHHLRGDTLLTRWGYQKVTLTDQQLVFDNGFEFKRVYKRSDAPKPRP